MLDQQHRNVGRDLLDQAADALALGGGKAGERLIEQQHARLGCERQAHVEQPLAAIGEGAGLGLLDAGEAEVAHDRRRFAFDSARLSAAAQQLKRCGWRACTASRMFSSTGSARKQIGDLKRAADAGAA